MMAAAIRVRFAPSPTGNLHLGGFRTALLNYLFAKKNNGKFILRIEDTDQSRIVPGAASQLEDDLKWLGIKVDESPTCGGSHGPYVQSERLHFYNDHIKKLIESSSAYECFCTPKRLDLLRKEAVRMNAAPGYDNKCRDLTRNEVIAKKAAGESHVIRFKVDPNPVEVNDMLFGKVQLTDKIDPVIIKSDGFPTYHYANIVDDHLMEISHVLRGVEWQSSTGLHLQMYRAFKWKPPSIGHLCVLLNNDGTKFSKRQADLSIKYYREQRQYPICLVNFVTKSGGCFHYTLDKLFTMEELVDQFDITKLNTNSVRLDFNYLHELNRTHIQNQIDGNFDGLIKELQEFHPNESEDYLRKILLWSKSRISSLKDLDEMTYLWKNPESANRSYSTPKEVLVSFATSNVQNVDEFAKAHNVNPRKFMNDLRLILCGLEKGPPINELLHILGPEEVKSRCESVVNKM